MSKISETPTPYRLHCVKDESFGSCGDSLYLTRQEYDRQLMRPNKTWQCPGCGCYDAIWDDEHYEKTMRPGITGSAEVPTFAVDQLRLVQSITTGIEILLGTRRRTQKEMTTLMMMRDNVRKLSESHAKEMLDTVSLSRTSDGRWGATYRDGIAFDAEGFGSTLASALRNLADELDEDRIEEDEPSPAVGP